MWSNWKECDNTQKINAIRKEYSPGMEDQGLMGASEHTVWRRLLCRYVCDFVVYLNASLFVLMWSLLFT